MAKPARSAVAKASRLMNPPNPPFSTPSKLRFQFRAFGSHTSNLMSESLVGLIMPVTRQEGGRTGREGKGRDGPAGTSWASVIDVPATFNADKLAQDR